jgi:uncharacterized protein (DUF849 family)
MKTILTCAVTGAVTSKESTPYLPITPEQISTSALEAAEAGASVVHIHVRNPDGSPSTDVELYRDTVDRIKQRNKDVLINLTTGPGARFSTDMTRLGYPSLGTMMMSAHKRTEHIRLIKPDLCSIDFNTMNQADNAIRFNHKEVVKAMLLMVQEAGTKPELEIFGSGDLMLAKEYVDAGLVKGIPLWQFATGIKYGWESCPETLIYATSIIGRDKLWSAFGISKNEMPILAQTVLLGGHVRVGMEDNIYLEKGVLAKTNAELVTKAVRIIKDLGGEIADYNETRTIYDVRR